MERRRRLIHHQLDIMKRFLAIFVLICTSVFFAMGVPALVHGTGTIEMSGSEGMVDQNITGMSFHPHTVLRVYEKGELVGTLSKESVLRKFLRETYADAYEKDYPDSELNVGEDVSLVREKTYLSYDNADEEILQYLQENQLFTLKCEAVEIADDTDVYERVYVLKKSLFTDALHDFLCLFVSEDELNQLESGEASQTQLNGYGSVPVSLKIDQTISYRTAWAPVDEVYTEKEEVFSYLCYGRDTQLQYDTVLGKDSVEGFAARHGLTRQQLIRINSQKLTSKSTAVSAGSSLCTTYLTSPLTVTVTVHRLVQETDEPAVSYVVNDAMAEDGETVLQEGKAGSENCLYEETWINGVLNRGTLTSSYTVSDRTDEIIAIEDDHTPLSGTGYWIMPVDHALILARFDAYEGHEGIDVINRYSRYGDVMAADTGTVAETGYDEEEGSYIVIDHHNGWYSHYGHLNSASDLQAGDTVERGQVIGQIGSSGNAATAELLFYITEEGSSTHLDACDGFVDCEAFEQE